MAIFAGKRSSGRVQTTFERVPVLMVIRTTKASQMAENEEKGTAKKKGEHLKKFQFKKGQTGNAAGRPRKFTTVLKSQGYKKSEIFDTLCVMLSMTSAELLQTAQNPDATVLERTVASAIAKGIQKGTMSEIETILSRAFGTPVATNKMTDEEGRSVAPVYVVTDRATSDALAKIQSKKA